METTMPAATEDGSTLRKLLVKRTKKVQKTFSVFFLTWCYDATLSFIDMSRRVYGAPY